MTLTAERVDPWRTRPGWGISVDLTPPEVVYERHLTRLRRGLGIGLLALLLVVGVGYLLAAQHHRAGVSLLQSEQVTTSRLRARAVSFQDITEMQGSLVRLRTQTGTVMSGDVDLDALSTRLSASLPPHVRLTSESISLSAPGTEAATGATAAGDPATGTTIGTVALAGKGRTLDDLAAYVERLQALKGVTSVVPTSNAATEAGVDFTVTLSLSTTLLSHRFDTEVATP